MLSNALKLVITLSLLAASIFLFMNYTAKDIRDIISHSGIYAPLIFILICFIKPVFIFIPSLGLTIIAGILFGPLWGTVYAIIGGTGSTLTGFYFARWLGKDFFERFTQNKKIFSLIEEWMRDKGKNTILSMRIFNIPWDIVSYWAGFTGVPFRDFYIASMISLFPMSFLYVYFGSTIFTPLTPGFIISLVIILAMGAIPHIRRRYRSKQDA